MKKNTNMRASFLSSKNFQRYMKDVSKHPVLTAQQESLLLEDVEKGSQAAIDKLVSANLKFVITIAKQYQNQGLTMEDLISEGNYGMLKAVKDFEPSRGFKFISYAVWWVRQSMLESLAEHSRTVRLPANKIFHIGKINKAYGLLEQEYHRPPTANELAKNLDLALSKVEAAMDANTKTLSMDLPLGEDGTSSLKDLITSNHYRADAPLSSSTVVEELGRALGKLSEKEAEVLKHMFGLAEYPQLTLAMTGEVLGVSAERVRQIKNNAIKKLSKNSVVNELKLYI